MDDKINRFEGKTDPRPDVSLTESQTGLDTQGRSADYDISLKDGREEIRTDTKAPRP